MPTSSPFILAPASPGEVLDRLTILDLKLKACTNDADRASIQYGIDALSTAWTKAIHTDPKTHPNWTKLYAINAELWRIEDDVRAYEQAADFGPNFVACARSVYKTNDRRAAQKRLIDDDLGSKLTDIKFHDPK